ncbi:hypothetical protein E2C01_060619 [Portunus trituberculatus]|uniref:Uncharacterized protein n=1 Tax=Portunus trituberculatus TaxID=210409 RepID=A0A5B7H1P2_PORTR|nr:hypothetical protein [Portunus trituberculatus]
MCERLVGGRKRGRRGLRAWWGGAGRGQTGRGHGVEEVGARRVGGGAAMCVVCLDVGGLSYLADHTQSGASTLLRGGGLFAAPLQKPALSTLC